MNWKVGIGGTIAAAVLVTAAVVIKMQNNNPGWKIYKNDKYHFTISYPPNYEVDLKNIGFVGGSDYYGNRDFNFLVDDPKVEPSHPGQYDGYNFAIFSGDTAVKQVGSYMEIVKNGDNYSPPLVKETVTVLGKSQQLYFLPPTTRTDTAKISYWFTIFPYGGKTFIVSGNYDIKLLKRILATFKAS